MNEQEQFWSREYASDYISKNSSFARDLGVDAWRKMLAKAEGINSALECGSNIGRNVDFLNALLPDAKKSIIEISRPAFEQVTRTYSLAHAHNGPIESASFPCRFDLVFTIGVLIHIHPDLLLKNMRQMFELSDKYVLMGEYFNRTPVMIEYQGQMNRLFKRDFGKLFAENFEVAIVDYGFLWGHIYDEAGFDDITWWLFKKR